MSACNLAVNLKDLLSFEEDRQLIKQTAVTKVASAFLRRHDKQCCLFAHRLTEHDKRLCRRAGEAMNDGIDNTE